MPHDFTQFDAWKKAMDLSVKIHAVTEKFPKREIYGITSQLRKAAVSVAANIAEGFGRFTYPDKMHKYVQARGELIEVMTELHYSHRVSYLSVDLLKDLLRDCTDVHMLLNALIKKMGILGKSLSPKS
ncbi:MAG: four helix bundle protein [Patescibacteria group bacterium]